MFAARSVFARSRNVTSRIVPVASKQQKRSAQVMPRSGTEDEMNKQIIEQIRARVKYQKELMAKKEHSLEEEIEEMAKWIKMSIVVGLPVCVLSAIYSYVIEEHHHRIEEGAPEYLKIRAKEYPWQCSDCDFFDLDCWDKCRKEKAAEAGN